MKSRYYDLTDFAHIDFNFVSLGSQVYCGPLIVGGLYLDDEFGTKVIFGLGGMQEIGINKEDINSQNKNFGLIYPFRRIMEEKTNKFNKLERKHSKYGNEVIHYGAIGFDFSYGIGLGARFDIYEFIDFMLGLFNYDIVGDDIKE